MRDLKFATATECLDAIKDLPFVREQRHKTKHGIHDALRLVTYGDHCGTDTDAANYRELVKRHGEVFYSKSGPCGERALLILNERGIMPFCDVMAGNMDVVKLLRRLASELIGLADNALLSQEQHRNYIDELTDAAWDEWLTHEVRGDLQLMDSTFDDWDDCGLPDGADAEAAFRKAYYAFTGNEWACDTATSVVNRRHGEAVSHAARIVFGWDV